MKWDIDMQRANLSPGAINKWTSNNVEEFKGEPGAIRLFKVAQEIECSMEYLLTGIKKYDNFNSSDSKKIYSRLY